MENHRVSSVIEEDIHLKFRFIWWAHSIKLLILFSPIFFGPIRNCFVKVRKLQKDFLVSSDSSKKRTDSFLLLLGQLEESENTKNSFKIIWPVECYKSAKNFICQKVQHFQALDLFSNLFPPILQFIFSNFFCLIKSRVNCQISQQHHL